MSSKTIFILALAFFTSSAFADQPQVSAQFWRYARVDIDASGAVTSLAFTDSTPGKDDPVGHRLEQIIRGWNFEPGKVNGKPAPTQTTLTLKMEVQKQAGDTYSIDLLDAQTGPGIISMAAPNFPNDTNPLLPINLYSDGEITLVLAFDISGAPTKIEVEKAETNSNVFTRKALVNVAVDAAKKWRFQPELVGGHPVAGSVRVPVVFCVQGSSWCADYAKAAAAKGDRATPNVPVALDSQVKLKDRVARIAL